MKLQYAKHVDLTIHLSFSFSLFESSSSPKELYLVGLLVEKGKDPLFEFKTMAPWDFFFLAVGVVFFGLGFRKRSTKHDTLRPFFLRGRGWYVFWGLLRLIGGVEKLFCREVVQYIMDLMKRQEVRVCLFIRSIILLKAKKE